MSIQVGFDSSKIHARTRLQQAQDRYQELNAEGDELAAKMQDGSITEDEQGRLKELLGSDLTGRSFGLLRDVADECEQLSREQARDLTLDHLAQKFGGNGKLSDNPPSQFVDMNGNAVRVFNKGERLADSFANDDVARECRSAGLNPLDVLSGVIGAMVTGNNNYIPPQMTGTVGVPGSGGYTVPSPLSAELIDLMRANLVLTAAGSRFIPMTAMTLTFARVTAEPTPGTVAEATTISPADFTFDTVVLDAKKLAVRSNVSRELWDDSINLSAELPRMLAAAMGVKAEDLLLNGGGTGEDPTGLNVDTNIPANAASGLVSWDLLSTAIEALMAANENGPYSIIMSPANYGLLDRQKASTAGTWLGASPAVMDAQKLVTSQQPDDQILVGNFASHFIGVRTNLLVETTTTGGSAFADHLVDIKLTQRLDGVASRPSRLYRLDGVTQA